MSWGFFLFVNWFNPGQAYAYYAILEQWPALLLAQNIVGCLAQAAGYVGFLLFVIRAPNNHTEPRWLLVERSLPYVFVASALLLIASYGDIFGYPTERLTRAGIILGFAFAACGLAILFMRKKSQTPADYQRLRWVLWGCLIGLPSYLIAELASETSIFDKLLGFEPSDAVIGLLYLINGVLCLFVFEAIRRQRVVSVWIPLRRVTILAFLLTIPVIFLHQQIEEIEHRLHLPGWAWLALAVIATFLISRLHEWSADFADGFFNRWLDKAEQKLGAAIRAARSPTEIERILADDVFHALGLTSAAAFRHKGSVLAREANGKGWDQYAVVLPSEEPALTPMAKGTPFKLKKPLIERLGLPSGLAEPVLAVPASNAARCFALSLYGPHQAGTDLDHHERAMLARIANDATGIYAELENAELREQVAALERELTAAKSPTATAAPKLMET
jgi:hypothetical protein